MKMKPFIAVLAVLLATAAPAAYGREKVHSLDGEWTFKTDPAGVGEKEGWFRPDFNRSAWGTVRVPHTWQTDPGTEDYFGTGWYARKVVLDPLSDDAVLQFEFDAAYRDAKIWIDGELVKEHSGSGWTPFSFQPYPDPDDYTPTFWIVVRVDNRFSEKAIPYADSFDWAADGGLIRSVRVRELPKAHIAALRVSSEPDLKTSLSVFDVRADVSLSGYSDRMRIDFFISDPSGTVLLQKRMKVPHDRMSATLDWRGVLSNAQLWHFDRPVQYRVTARLSDEDRIVHEKEADFGIRKVEIGGGRFILNGEPMRLMGVEWMPGSDPRYGMAESPEFMRAILKDMKNLNCVLSRFHWQQDGSVFDFCDSEGMLLQEEIPAWGGFEALDAVREIQKIQTEEMIGAHFNHPSIYAWGLCNEIRSQGEAGRTFVRMGMDFARKLDPGRLLTFASNQLQRTPRNDASGLMDFIEWNDYYESWYGGTLASVGANLDSIGRAFPVKSVVISEYGLCECSPENPAGDPRRIEIMKTHTDAYRRHEAVAGAVFFDYNDYRTHMGDKSRGAFRQRVHGVTDLTGRRKPSWEALKREMSPVRSIAVGDTQQTGDSTGVKITIQTRALENDMPAYTLRNYLLIWTALNVLDQPIESGKVRLPDLAPGSTRFLRPAWKTFDGLSKVRLEIYRPTGYSVLAEEKNFIKKQ
jgi:beta-galactosidase